MTEDVINMLDALREIKKIAQLNYEYDEKLRSNGARTLKRIIEIATPAIIEAEKRIRPITQLTQGGK